MNLVDPWRKLFYTAEPVIQLFPIPESFFPVPKRVIIVDLFSIKVSLLFPFQIFPIYPKYNEIYCMVLHFNMLLYQIIYIVSINVRSILLNMISPMKKMSSVIPQPIR